MRSGWHKFGFVALLGAGCSLNPQPDLPHQSPPASTASGGSSSTGTGNGSFGVDGGLSASAPGEASMSGGAGGASEAGAAGEGSDNAGAGGEAGAANGALLPSGRDGGP